MGENKIKIVRVVAGLLVLFRSDFILANEIVKCIDYIIESRLQYINLLSCDIIRKFLNEAPI